MAATMAAYMPGQWPSPTADDGDNLLTCTRCNLIRPLSFFPSRAPTLRCAHPPMICSRCLSEYTQYQLLLFPTQRPFCPAAGCIQTLDVALPTIPHGSFSGPEAQQQAIPDVDDSFLEVEDAQETEDAEAPLADDKLFGEVADMLHSMDNMVRFSRTFPSIDELERAERRRSRPLPQIPVKALPTPVTPTYDFALPLSPQAEPASPRSSLASPHEASPLLLLRTCQVCLDDLPPPRFSRHKPSPACQHPINVCRRCLRRYLRGEIEHMGNVLLKCPVAECRAEMSYDVVKRATRPEVFERYDALLLRKSLGKEENFIWCKNPQCSSGQFFDGIDGGSVIVTCAQCGSKSCAQHDIVWHEGLTCWQYDDMKAEKEQRDALVETYFSQHTKQCPKCKSPIEKISGCDHMICRPPGGCGNEFCWQCLADYEPIRTLGNHRHAPTCTYYRARNGSAPTPAPRTVPQIGMIPTPPRTPRYQPTVHVPPRPPRRQGGCTHQ